MILIMITIIRIMIIVILIIMNLIIMITIIIVIITSLYRVHSQRNPLASALAPLLFYPCPFFLVRHIGHLVISSKIIGIVGMSDMTFDRAPPYCTFLLCVDIYEYIL